MLHNVHFLVVRGSRRLGSRAVKDEGDTCRGGRRTGGGIVKLASRQSEVVKAPCPSDAPRKSWTNCPCVDVYLNYNYGGILVLRRVSKKKKKRWGHGK